MELQISHSVCAKVSKEGILQSKKGDNGKKPETVEGVERSKNHRGRSLPGPHICWQRIRRSQRRQVSWDARKERAAQCYTNSLEKWSTNTKTERFGGGGYCVDTAGKNTRRIQEYIQNQLKEDEKGEQLTMQPKSPFTGGKQQQNAAGRPYLRVNVCAKNRGLCPHLNPPGFAGRWLFAARRGKYVDKTAGLWYSLLWQASA